jgi:hypothetical protein
MKDPPPLLVPKGGEPNILSTKLTKNPDRKNILQNIHEGYTNDIRKIIVPLNLT